MKHYIYKLYFDSGPKKCYIGQTNDIGRRYNEHTLPSRLVKKTLRTNWIRKNLEHGHELRLKILAVVDIDNVNIVEMQFIKMYKGYGYILKNSTDGGEGTKGLSEESKLKKSLSLCRYVYIVESSEGETLVTRNLNTFCIEYGLSSSAMYEVSVGRRKHHKAWKVTRVEA